MPIPEKGVPKQGAIRWAGTSLGLALAVGFAIGAVFGNAALGASVGVVVGALIELASWRPRRGDGSRAGGRGGSRASPVRRPVPTVR